MDISHIDIFKETLVPNGNLQALKDLLESSWVTKAEKEKNHYAIKDHFKLYPYEWLSHEELGQYLFEESSQVGKVRVIEPAWKLVLGNKALLALLWSKSPNHPNLLQYQHILNWMQTNFEMQISLPSQRMIGKVKGSSIVENSGKSIHKMALIHRMLILTIAMGWLHSM